MKLPIIALIFLFSTLVFAKTSVEVKNAFIRFPPPGSTTTAMFGDFINNGNSDRKIIKASGAISDDFEMHEMAMDNGKMVMRNVETILLPKKSTTALKPGGLHVMIFNLKRSLKENETVDVQLNLENNEKVQIKAIVKNAR